MIYHFVDRRAILTIADLWWIFLHGSIDAILLHGVSILDSFKGQLCFHI
jgi:hypothetical protein